MHTSDSFAVGFGYAVLLFALLLCQLALFSVEVVKHDVETLLRGEDINLAETAQTFFQSTYSNGLCMVYQLYAGHGKGNIVIAKVYPGLTSGDYAHFFQGVDYAGHSGLAEGSGSTQILLGAYVVAADGHQHIPLVAGDVNACSVEVGIKSPAQGSADLAVHESKD